MGVTAAALLVVRGTGRAPEPGGAPAVIPAPAGGSAAAVVAGPDGAEMVLVPAGEFWMGSAELADEMPRRLVHLDAYYIDRHEVTNARYRTFLEGQRRPRRPAYWIDPRFNAAAQPVVGVLWSEAAAYCRWAGKRLPTEAEWEKAARGPDGRRYPWGDHWEPGRATSADGGAQRPAPVGSRPGGASQYGALDMAGNVAEWVADWYARDAYEHAAAKNPTGPDAGAIRVLRGGSWLDYYFDLRATGRRADEPAVRDSSIGFRCARDLAPR